VKLTVDTAAIQSNSRQVADKDSKANASRSQNRQVGCALSPSLVCGSEDDKDQEEGQQGFQQPACSQWEACQQPVAAALGCLESCLISLQQRANSKAALNPALSVCDEGHTQRRLMLSKGRIRAVS